MAPATTTIEHELDAVKVTVEGVPAKRCQACGEISLDGKVMIPIDEAIEEIMIAAGVASRSTPDEEAALREENRALARTLGQGDSLLDDPADTPVSEPSGAARTA
jgi:YgiT-type zinc finger domain-containing protein